MPERFRSKEQRLRSRKPERFRSKRFRNHKPVHSTSFSCKRTGGPAVRPFSCCSHTPGRCHSKEQRLRSHKPERFRSKPGQRLRSHKPGQRLRSHKPVQRHSHTRVLRNRKRVRHIHKGLRSHKRVVLHSHTVQRHSRCHNKKS
ncbi:hypothetical protein [Stieleria magnilauensis]|uniref:hypothetical protein n=1 Tax=Stieleria magnilauensis TaxID=2527963 RepID=UPI003AF939B0